MYAYSVRYTQYKAFEKHLQSSAPSNFSSLYSLIIKDPGERALAFDLLKKRLNAETVILFQADSQGEKELLSQLDDLSLFSGRQLLHLQGCEKLSKGGQASLEKRIQHILPSIVLVLSAETISRQGAFYKAIEKHGVVLDIGEEKPWEKEKSLAEWVIERAQQEKKAIDPEAVNMLARGTQGSLAILASEWEKLLTYCGEKSKITVIDVHSICCLTSSDTGWLLGEAILGQNHKNALETAHRLLDQGNSLFPLLRSLRHQVTTALFLATAEREGKRELISQKFPYLKGHMLEKQVQAASKFGPRRLAVVLQTIDEFEFKAKDGCDDPKLLLTLLCTRIIP